MVTSSAWQFAFDSNRPLLVYGPENVTSGCISDLAHATDVATRMVQVCKIFIPAAECYAQFLFAQNYGYSQKIGPVYYDEQDLQTMSSQKREEIEAEVRMYVTLPLCS